MLRHRCGAAGFGKLQWARGQNKYFATTPAHTQRALDGAHCLRDCIGKTTSFFRSRYTQARNRHFLFSVPNYHTTFFTCLRSSSPPGTLPAPTAPVLHLSTTILRKASRSATEEEDSEFFPTTSGCFVIGCRCFVARIHCDGQYFYWAERLVFGNKRGN